MAASTGGIRFLAGGSGPIYFSTDGANWTPISHNASWYSAAVSSDGSKMVAVSSYIHTSRSGTNTTIGTDGYLTGPVHSAVELQYIGGGKFMPLSWAGAVQGY